MSAIKSTSLRIKPEILQKIQEKCPNVNRSLLINNVFDYILSQNENLILEFCRKNH